MRGFDVGSLGVCVLGNNMIWVEVMKYEKWGGGVEVTKDVR